MGAPAQLTDAHPKAGRRALWDLRGRRYAVVGGGLSGLAAAWYLQGRGAETHIFERDTELGGRARSGLLGERLLTLGGKNIGRSYHRFRAFTSSLGDHRYEHFGINSSRVIDGRVVTFDSTHRGEMLRNLSATPARDLVRLARLAAVLRRDAGGRFLSEVNCRALAQSYGTDSVRDAFGERLRELILRSLTVRVSAAEPDEVPMSNVLPYVGMLTDTYDQLAAGMHAVVAAAARRSRVSVGTTVERLVLEGDRVRGIEVTTQGGDPATVHFDGVVVATHAHAAAPLLESTLPLTASLLREVRYFPLLVLLVEYERPVFERRVRAVVFGPEGELSNAGAYGTGELQRRPLHLQRPPRSRADRGRAGRRAPGRDRRG